MWQGCGCATARAQTGGDLGSSGLCASGLAVTPGAQGPPESCLQLACSPWNSPNPDCIIAAVLLNMQFFLPRSHMYLEGLQGTCGSSASPSQSWEEDHGRRQRLRPKKRFSSDRRKPGGWQTTSCPKGWGGQASPGSAAAWGHPVCPSLGEGAGGSTDAMVQEAQLSCPAAWTRADFRYKKTEDLGQGCDELSSAVPGASPVLVGGAGALESIQAPPQASRYFCPGP